MSSESQKFHGLYIDELKSAFDEVADPADWRESIHTIVPADKLAITVAAVMFFTATPCEVFPSELHRFFNLNSIGYRRGPAGDH